MSGRPFVIRISPNDGAEHDVQELKAKYCNKCGLDIQLKSVTKLPVIEPMKPEPDIATTSTPPKLTSPLETIELGSKKVEREVEAVIAKPMAPSGVQGVSAGAGRNCEQCGNALFGRFCDVCGRASWPLFPVGAQNAPYSQRRPRIVVEQSWPHGPTLMYDAFFPMAVWPTLIKYPTEGEVVWQTFVAELKKFLKLD